YNEISIRGSTPLYTNNFTLEAVEELSYSDALKMIGGAVGADVCDHVFKTNELIQLKNSKKKYDVVVTELFSTECMLGWAWHFKAHSVVITSSENLPWATDRFGLPDNPSYIPTYFVDYTSKMTLYERLVNTWTLIKGKLLYELYSTKDSNVIAKRFFGPDLPDLNVLAYNTTLHLINTHFSISNSRPLLPNTVEVAGLHVRSPKPVDKHFNQILETDTKGVIYFSMGSLFLPETFPKQILQAMFDALSEVPYKVLWKANHTNFSPELRIPANVHFETWMPQHDILCDDRVKLFISHGGMMGTQESVSCGKPILGMPIFADQTLNIKRAESSGYGKMLNLQTVTKENFANALRELLFDPKYAENVKKVSALFKDRILNPLDTSVYWIEYVIRHNGAPHLQSSAKDLAWYQYYLVDVIAIALTIPAILSYIAYVISKIFLTKIIKKSKIKTN
ncbi:hypothetical protein GWI33_001504, partial [Rhynchophorus ferrugineus]